MVDDNQSFYTKAVKALIDEFVATHPETLDMWFIYVGSLSNSGFMTCRMIASILA